MSDKGANGWLQKYRGPISLGLVALLIIGVVVWLVRRPEAPPLVVATPPTQSPAPAIIKVYVSGAVVSPGAYALHQGDRTEDALRAAGGPTAEADLDRINLAARVRDEQHILVPAKGESQPTEGKLDLNTATQAELEALPGIGPAYASRIIDYRQSEGPFRKVEELLEAKLIPSSTFQEIKDLVTVR